jgi:hypothetical protein
MTKKLINNATSNRTASICLSAENRTKQIVYRNLKDRLIVHSQRYDIAEPLSNTMQGREGIIVKFKKKLPANLNKSADITTNTPSTNINSICSVFLENDPDRGFLATAYYPSSDKFNKQDLGLKLESSKLLFECGCHAVFTNPSLNPLIPGKTTAEQLLWGLLVVQAYNDEIKHLNGGPPVEIELSHQQLKDIDLGMRSGKKSAKGKMYFRIMELYEILKPKSEIQFGPKR